MPGHACRRQPASRSVGVLLALLWIVAPAVPAGAAAGPAYRLPVDGTVVQQFDAPPRPYAAGHRGVDLAAPPGTPVVAAADGEVSHAQLVAGTTWVSLAHPDGTTTSYWPLARIRVAAGDRVVGGARLGVVAEGGHGGAGTDRGLHWGARRSGRYLDPLALLGPVKLPTLVGAGGWHGSDPAVVSYDPWQGARWNGVGIHGSPRAERPGFAVPPNANHLFVVGGLNSSTGSPVLAPGHLGYGEDSATRYSYAGVDTAGRPLPYGPDDTWDGIDAAARDLAEQLRAQQRRQPFRAVDLVGHSQGGVVLLHYLANYHDAFDPTLPAIGNVVTIAAPHEGSDAASLARAVREHSVLGLVAAAGLYLGDPAGDSFRGAAGTPVDELRVGSRVLRELSRSWSDTVAAAEAGPLATGTRLLTIGGASDRMVGTHRAELPGGEPDGEVVLEHRVLPGNHEGVLETEAVREVTYRFLRGAEPVDSPGHLQTGVSWLNQTFWRMLGHGLEAHDLRNMGRSALKLTRTPPTVPAGRAAAAGGPTP